MSVSSQRTFMQNGGVYAGILQAKYDSGELVPPDKYVYREYPKMVRLSRGVARVQKSAEVIRAGRVDFREWEEDVEQFEDVIVHSEEEEERVRNGGKSEAQIEEERMDLYAQCKARGLNVDPTWPLIRLQRELGTAPSRETVDALQARVQQLETEASLRARIAELEAKLHQPQDDADELRAELAAHGVEVDGRWGVARLRAELDKVRS